MLCPQTLWDPPGKLKIIHLSITEQCVSLCYATECYSSFFLLCSVLCLYACVRYNLEIVLIYAYVKKKVIQIVQQKISQHNMSIWRYDFQIGEESQTNGILIKKNK
jgi:hypothetical protein